jgi:hypothetical protein
MIFSVALYFSVGRFFHYRLFLIRFVSYGSTRRLYIFKIIDRCSYKASITLERHQYDIDPEILCGTIRFI